MIKNKPLVLALALASGLAAAPLQAQQAMSFGLQSLEDRFNAAAPKIGKRVPNLPVYRPDGEKVRFRDLVRGDYSVVVLGCLT